MFEIIFVVLTVGLMALAWWWLKRRRRDLLEAIGEPSEASEPASEPQALTRDALTNRPRSFDPSAWDDSPDPVAAGSQPATTRREAARPAAAAETEGDAPTYFDRDFLERQRRERATGQADPPQPD